MSDIQPEVPVEAPKSKQYLLMVDQLTMVFIMKLMPTIQFLEVEGFSVSGSDTHQALATPVKRPIVVEGNPVVEDVQSG